MDRNNAFRTISRETLATYEVEQRVKNYKEFYQPITNDLIEKQAARCMDCGTPFCHGYGCPLGNSVPEWNELIYQKKWKEALRVLERTSNFPEFTARLCPALCESACTLGLGFEAVSIRNIELSLVEKGFENGWIKPRPPGTRSGKRIAVIGSGPAGLASADSLNKLGHSVEVFEKDETPGGLLRLGIPDFKLEKHIIDRRIKLLEQEGVTFSCGVEAGIDVSPRYLQSRFDALVIAIGCGVPRDLPVPGRELDGICFALDYLIQQNRVNAGVSIPADQRLDAKGKKVVVIGGGDTGADCVGTAVRQGAEKIMQIEILPQPPAERDDSMPWPTHPRLNKKNHSHEEGGQQQWSVMTTSFNGTDGNLTSLSCVEAEFKDGAFVPIKGTEFELEADYAVLAAGFIQPEYEGIIDPLGIAKNAKGSIDADANGLTSLENVFAAGDAVSGPSLIVKAIAGARDTVQAVDRYLRS